MRKADGNEMISDKSQSSVSVGKKQYIAVHSEEMIGRHRGGEEVTFSMSGRSPVVPGHTGPRGTGE